MSFTEFDDCFEWQCDGCGLKVEFPPRDFWRCKDELKARGWRFIRDDCNGEWAHRCLKCVKKEKESVVSWLDSKPGRPGRSG